MSWINAGWLLLDLIIIEANLFFYGAEVAGELERDFLSLCAGASEVTAVSRQGVSQRQRLAEGVGRVLAPLL